MRPRFEVIQTGPRGPSGSSIPGPSVALREYISPNGVDDNFDDFKEVIENNANKRIWAAPGVGRYVLDYTDPTRTINWPAGTELVGYGVDVTKFYIKLGQTPVATLRNLFKFFSGGSNHFRDLSFEFEEVDYTSGGDGSVAFCNFGDGGKLSFHRVNVDFAVREIGGAVSNLVWSLRPDATSDFETVELEKCFWRRYARCWLKGNLETADLGKLHVLFSKFKDGQRDGFALNGPKALIEDVLFMGNTFKNQWAKTNGGRASGSTFQIGLGSAKSARAIANRFSGVGDFLHVEEKAEDIIIAENHFEATDADCQALRFFDNTIGNQSAVAITEGAETLFTWVAHGLSAGNGVLFTAVDMTAAVTIDIANPAVIHWTGHGLQAGDRVFFTSTDNTATVTFDIASPGVVNQTGHGRSAGDEVHFTTAGYLPDGIIAGQPYYVLAAGLTADTYRIGATAGGSAINFGGVQLGVHTVHFFGLPTGIVASFSAIRRDYFVMAAGLTADAFQISSIAGGAAVVTSGSQSGSHTGHHYKIPNGLVASDSRGGTTYYILASGLTADQFKVALTDGGTPVATTAGSPTGTVTANHYVPVRRMTIANNTVVGPGSDVSIKAGILFASDNSGFPPVEYCVVTGNQIYGWWRGAALTEQLQGQSDGRALIFKLNMIARCAVGIFSAKPTTDAEDNIINHCAIGLYSTRGGLWGRQTFRDCGIPVLAPSNANGTGGRVSILGWKVPLMDVDLPANGVLLVDLFPLGSLLRGELKVNWNQSNIAGVTAHRRISYDGSTLTDVDLLSIGAGEVVVRSAPNGIVVNGAMLALAINNLDTVNAYNNGTLEAVFDGLHHFLTV